MDGAPRTHARYRPNDSGRSASSMRLMRRVDRANRALAVHISNISDRARALHAAAPKRVVRHVRRRSLIARFASERTLPVGVGLLVLIATVASIAPSVAPPVGATTGIGSAPRIAIGGGDGGARYHAAEIAGLLGGPAARVGTDRLTTDPDDGTLWKPVAVDTTVQDATGLLKHYQVQSGDSLSGIATKFGLSMMTLWWANNLTSKDALTIGQTLVVPPIDGLVATVKVGDTLDTVAAKNKITTTAILDANHLTDSNLIVGQTLLLPGAAGDPIPLPKIVAVKPSTKSAGAGGATAPSTAVYPAGGGAWAWPVVGHNYVSRLDVRQPDRLGAAGHCRLRGLEGQRWRLPGVGLAWQRPVHRLLPHVRGEHGGRGECRSRSASRTHRAVRLGNRAARPLRGLGRLPLGPWQLPGQRARLLLVARRALRRVLSRVACPGLATQTPEPVGGGSCRAATAPVLAPARLAALMALRAATARHPPPADRRPGCLA